MFRPTPLLTDLVRLPSVNPMGRSDIPLSLSFESRVTDYLDSKFRELKADYERQDVAPGRQNIVAIYEPRTPATQTVLWEAHQDTVPVDNMTIDPFAAVVKDGRLYGRGACDVKAGIACMLAAFSRLITERPAGQTRVIVAFTIDEEHTFLGVQHLMKSLRPIDFAIAAEPTCLDLVTSHKGVARWQIETTGVACHSSRPEDGVNAVYRMAKIVSAVEAYAGSLRTSRRDPLLGEPTISLGRIEGGAAPNTVPDLCRIILDRRLLPGESTAQAVADLDRFLKSFPGVSFPITTHPPHLDCPPLAQAKSPWVDRLAAIAGEVSGRTVSRLAVPYGTDASTIAEAGIPAVVFGPGDIAQAHTKDEWVELAQVDQAAEILFRLATHTGE
ncbi:MAG: M20 family metallopeptidase [Gemmataceae bacterium]